MTEITEELTALNDEVNDLGFGRVWLAHLPAEYKAGELAIRYVGGDTDTETGYHFRLSREYQFVFFGRSEHDCLTKGSALQRILNNTHKIKVGESGYLTLGSFSLSQPFKTEGAEVYGIIGILQATTREARHFEAVPKIGGMTIDVKPKSPESGEPTGEHYEITEGNGACK